MNYTFRKSAFEKPCTWTITAQGLLYESHPEGHQYLIPYKSITFVRLQFQPYHRYRHNNYRCRIKSTLGISDILSTSYVDFSKFTDQAETYTAFIKALLALLRKENPNCKLYSGQTTQAFYGNLILLLISVFTLCWLSLFLPLQGKLVGIGLLLIAAWSYLRMSFVVNLPRKIGGDIPKYVLPHARQNTEVELKQ